jgi:hypothetical protein
MVFGVCGSTAAQGLPDPALGDPLPFFPAKQTESIKYFALRFLQCTSTSTFLDCYGQPEKFHEIQNEKKPGLPRAFSV